MKKIIVLIIAVVIVAVAGSLVWFMGFNNKVESTNNSNNNSNVNEENNDENTNDKTNTNKNVAIIYFSATGTTEKVAGYIKEVAGGDLIEIIPKDEYTDNDLAYGNENSRANKEQNDSKARPEIKNRIDTDSYDVIYLGYPIWWDNVPKIILTFLDNHNLDGKTVIPFCTSSSSSIDASLNTLKDYNKNVNWIDGERLSTAKNEVTNWVNGLNY